MLPLLLLPRGCPHLRRQGPVAPARYPTHAFPPINQTAPPPPSPPQFRIKERGSSVNRECRAGLVLFLVSVFSVLLNPVILSGAGSGYNTGMPPTDVALATAISSGVGTLTMGIFGNYPWVLGVQLGSNK